MRTLKLIGVLTMLGLSVGICSIIYLFDVAVTYCCEVTTGWLDYWIDKREALDE